VDRQSNKHCQIPFGAYVQANNEPTPTNTNAPRTIDCIYLRSFPNIQGGHELMDLRTGRVITRRRITEIPVTELVIQAVENMAHDQGITTLKITGRHTSPIYPADWIAGVDYENHENQKQFDEDYIEDEEELIEAEIDNEDIYDRIDPTEMEDLAEFDISVDDNEEELNDQDEDEYESDPAPEDEREDVQEDETEDIEVHEDENTEPEEVPRTTRSGRVVVKPTRFID
jgi:hypothetical protein